MKIENKPTLVSIDSKRISKKDVKSESSADVDSTKADSVNTKLTTALNNVLKGIEASGLTAADVHSNVSEKVAVQLLNDSPVQAVRPKVSNQALLAIADRVSFQMLQEPQKAVGAFSDLKASRVSELLANS